MRSRDAAATVLAFGLDARQHVEELSGERLLLDCLSTACAALPLDSAARSRAEELRSSRNGAGALAADVAELLSDLRFQPFAEASLPEGVPGFQALDELELRRYPAYRLVRTSMRNGAMAAFWPLFRHIQERQIAMTTPVQVDWRADGERQRVASMAFLYGSPELGPLGADGSVEVVDQPPTTVLTIGSRGYDRPARIAELRARIDAWLASNRDWVADGPLRTMNYNSPSVGPERRYFEVQQPVRQRDAAAAGKEPV